MPKSEAERWHRQAENCLRRGDYAGVRAACVEVLRLEPQFADAHFLHGIACAAGRRFADAVRSIERAIDLDPARADYRAQLARCLVSLGRDAAAVTAAEEAWARQPSDAVTFDTIGVVMAYAGLHRRALESFERTVALAPRNPAHLFNLAAALRIVGEIDRAEELFEKIVTLAPDHYRAHSVLAQLRTQTREHNHIERLRELLTGPSDVDRELHLRHALAKELEDVGEIPEAFRQLGQGKARKRRALGYTFAHDEAVFDRMEAICDRAFVAADGGHPSEEPIFVVGMPRSGTTLVERILSGHSQVASAGELPAFPRTVKLAAATRTADIIDAETIEAAAGCDPDRLGECYLDATRVLTGRTAHFVDKLPLNVLYAGFIARALPRAKIICLRRGALDTCLANYRQLFAPGFRYYQYAYDLLDVGRYYARFERLVSRWRNTLPAASWLEVRYEDLVTQPEPVARQLLAFVGLDWEDRCLAIEKNESPVATASAVQVREPIHARSVGRWRRYASELQPLMVVLRDAGVQTEAD